MSDLSALYQALVLDHNSKPRNFRRLSRPSHTAEGHNPICGDRFTVYLNVEDDVVEDACFEGTGCAISKASASLMTAAIKGKTTREVQDLFERFCRLIAGTGSVNEDLAILGKLSIFARVSEFPGRVKCATLSWHTVVGALSHATKPISTE
jgi:nitrogen fixation NifU-like protein